MSIQVIHIQAGFAAIQADGQQVGSIERISNRRWGVFNMRGKMLTAQHSLYACETWVERRSYKLVSGEHSVSRSNRSQSSAANGCETKSDIAAALFWCFGMLPCVALALILVAS